MPIITYFVFTLVLLCSPLLGVESVVFAQASKITPWNNKYDVLFNQKVWPKLGSSEDIPNLEFIRRMKTLLASGTLDSEEIYLSKRHLVGFVTEGESQVLCTESPPRADDTTFRAWCLLFSPASYEEKKRSLSDIVAVAEVSEPNTNLLSATLLVLSDISTNNSDYVQATALLEKALVALPKEDSRTYRLIIGRIAFLYVGINNRKSTILKGLQYFHELIAHEKGGRDSEGVDTDELQIYSYNIAIVKIFSLGQYAEASEILKGNFENIGYGMDALVFRAFALLKMGRLSEAKEQLKAVNLQHYNEPSRLPFLKCYIAIIKHFAEPNYPYEECIQLPPNTQEDVVIQVTHELMAKSIPEGSRLKLLEQFYRYQTKKILPQLQYVLDSHTDTVELERARAEVARQKIEAETARLASESQQKIKVIIFVSVLLLLLAGAASVVSVLRIRHNKKIQAAEHSLRLEAEARSNLASLVAHRMNNPLNYIRGGFELLKQENQELQRQTLTLFEGNEEDQAVQDLRQSFVQSYDRVLSSLELIENGLLRSTDCVKEIRGVSGVDGYAITKVDLSKLLGALTIRLEESLGSKLANSIEVKFERSQDFYSCSPLLLSVFYSSVKFYLERSQQHLVLTIAGDASSLLMRFESIALTEQDIRELRSLCRYLSRIMTPAQQKVWLHTHPNGQTIAILAR